MKLHEAKQVANSALAHVMDMANAAKMAHAKTVNAYNAMDDEELADKNHPIHAEKTRTQTEFDGAKELATTMLSKHIGAELGTKQAEQQTAETNAKLADAQAKETEARAGLVAKAGDHMNADNAHLLIHPPAAPAADPKLAGAKDKAKNNSQKPKK